MTRDEMVALLIEKGKARDEAHAREIADAYIAKAKPAVKAAPAKAPAPPAKKASPRPATAPPAGGPRGTTTRPSTLPAARADDPELGPALPPRAPGAVAAQPMGDLRRQDSPAAIEAGRAAGERAADAIKPTTIGDYRQGIQGPPTGGRPVDIPGSGIPVPTIPPGPVLGRGGKIDQVLRGAPPASSKVADFADSSDVPLGPARPTDREMLVTRGTITPEQAARLTDEQVARLASRHTRIAR
jgi:hypothetical protein